MNTDIDNVRVLAVEANLCVCRRSSQAGLFLNPSVQKHITVKKNCTYFVDELSQQERNCLSAAAKVPSVPAVTNATFQPSPPLHFKVYQLFICCLLKHSVMPLCENYGERSVCMMAGACCDKHVPGTPPTLFYL